MYWQNIVYKIFPSAENVWENWNKKMIGFELTVPHGDLEMTLDVDLLEKEFGSSQISVKARGKVRDDMQNCYPGVSYWSSKCKSCGFESDWSGIWVGVAVEVVISNVKFPDRPK